MSHPEKQEKEKKEREREHRDGTRLIHDAILVSGVLSETQSYSHTLPHHPGAYFLLSWLPIDSFKLAFLISVSPKKPVISAELSCDQRPPKGPEDYGGDEARRSSPYNVAVALQEPAPCQRSIRTLMQVTMARGGLSGSSPTALGTWQPHILRLRLSARRKGLRSRHQTLSSSLRIG